MEVSVSGFKCVGSWDEVVEHGDRITNHLLQRDDVDDEALAEWNRWRPDRHESLDDEVRERTAEQTSVNEGPGEKDKTSAREDAKEAGKKLAKSPKTAVSEDINEAGEDMKDGARRAARAVDSASRKTLRAFEETVYRRVMTQVSPCYFDNELISANISRKATQLTGSNESETMFVFEININDDTIKQAVREALEEADDVDLD